MKKRIIKRTGIVILVLIVTAGSTGIYMWFKPHRDVQAAKAYAELKVSDLVNEFLKNAGSANAKYLSGDGNSKVLIIQGRVHSITTNQSGEKVIILKEEAAKTGVSATFTQKTSPDADTVKTGDMIKIKGAITAGNRYDADLDLYEYATLVQCDIVK